MQHRVSVLVADDSLPVHQLFRNALQTQASIKLLHALSGAECLDALEQGVDVAFIDIHMPDHSGLEALWGARTTSGTKTFVAVMSGRRSQRCVNLARQLDAYELLLKPFRAEDIQHVLKIYQRLSTPLHVLLVDDSATFRRIMRKVLEKSIFRLKIDDTGDPVAALASGEAARYDVVFLDCNLPGLNGLDMLVRLREQNPDIKVVMISGEQNPRREAEALRLGAVAFLNKPFFPGEIDAVLHQALGMRSPKLATDGWVGDFSIKIHGRTIAVEHQKTGHIYEYAWFPDAPHLRMSKVRANPEADTAPDLARGDAEWAAVLELQNARLLNTGDAAQVGFQLHKAAPRGEPRAAASLSSPSR
jgi:CheY-like chemotaxis protein